MPGDPTQPVRQRMAKPSGIVGAFIRQRRETLGLSQRALGQLFEPPVTTQFISNVERGVTPLPPVHIPTLTKALQVGEADFRALLEKEYTIKLSGRLGGPTLAPDSFAAVSVSAQDYEFFRKLYACFTKAEPSTKQAFMQACETLLKTSRQ